jgi:hypothetical protein
MAFNPAPTGWFSGISVSATELTIPFTALNTLDDTKADPTTGDVREIVYNFCEAFSDKWATTTSADRPDQLTLNTSTSVTTSGAQEILTKIYTIRVALTVDDVSIVEE